MFFTIFQRLDIRVQGVYETYCLNVFYLRQYVILDQIKYLYDKRQCIVHFCTLQTRIS